jgi:hypothetical protein
MFATAAGDRGPQPARSLLEEKLHRPHRDVDELVLLSAD